MSNHQAKSFKLWYRVLYQPPNSLAYNIFPTAVYKLQEDPTARLAMDPEPSASISVRKATLQS